MSDFIFRKLKAPNRGAVHVKARVDHFWQLLNSYSTIDLD
jgi:hypothetical protein